MYPIPINTTFFAAYESSLYRGGVKNFPLQVTYSTMAMHFWQKNLNLFLLTEFRVAFISWTGETLLCQQNSQCMIYISLSKICSERTQVLTARSPMSHRVRISPKGTTTANQLIHRNGSTLVFTVPQPSTEPSKCSGLNFATQDKSSWCQAMEEWQKAQKGQSSVLLQG